MDKFDVLKKYGLHKKATIGRSIGETDLTSRFYNYANIIDCEVAQRMHKVNELLNSTKCLKLSEIPNVLNVTYTDCYYWYTTVANEMNLCSSCKFFIDNLQELIKSIDELSITAKEFREDAENICREK